MDDPEGKPLRLAKHRVAPEPGAPPLDSEVVEDLRSLRDGDGSSLLGELSAIFLRDTPLRLAGMRDALARSDAPAAERFAHAIRGSSGNLGAMSLFVLAATFDDMAHEGSLEEAEALLSRMEAEFERVRAALEATTG